MNATTNKSSTKPAPLTEMLRDEEFVFLGLCADRSVRVGVKGGRALQLPWGHVAYVDVLNLAKIADVEAFESAVMGWVGHG